MEENNKKDFGSRGCLNAVWKSKLNVSKIDRSKLTMIMKFSFEKRTWNVPTSKLGLGSDSHCEGTGTALINDDETLCLITKGRIALLYRFDRAV